jgi:hypothetical protein
MASLALHEGTFCLSQTKGDSEAVQGHDSGWLAIAEHLHSKLQVIIKIILHFLN